MKSFIVLGLGRFGQSVAKTLHDQGYDVLAVDKDEDMVQDIAEFVTHAAIVDVTDEDAVRDLGVTNFDVAVVSIGSNMQASVMATLILKELGVKYIIAKALNDLHGKLLLKVGADRVVYPEREMGERVAKSLISKNVLDYMEISPEYSIMEISAPSEWVGKSLKDTNIRSKYDIIVMAVKKEKGKGINLYPRAEYVIKEGDILVLIGSDKDLDKFRNKILG